MADVLRVNHGALSASFRIDHGAEAFERIKKLVSAFAAGWVNAGRMAANVHERKNYTANRYSLERMRTYMML
jgi:hypothetical protein